MSKLSDEWQEYIKKRINICDKGCWNWILSLHRDGYAKINKNGFWQGHRLSYAAFYPNIYNSKLLVLHKCHNRKCVNPEHLYQGTHFDNNQDTMKAGRGKNQFTCEETHPYTILTEKTVLDIRELFSLGYPCTNISQIYSIPRTTISYICHRHSWRHI